MSDNRLILVKCITLLYRESMLTEKESNSADLVRTVLEGIKLPELSLSMNSERECLMGLKDTALYMCSSVIATVYEKEDLLQRLKVNCANDEKLYDAFAQGIERDMDEPSLKRTVLSIRKYINDTFRENELINLISKANNTLKFQRESVKDIRQYVVDLSSSLEPYLLEANRKDPAVVGSVDIGDTTGLSNVFQDIQNADNATSILRCGFQGINKMLQGGFRRGECWVTPALQHNYKTGFSLTIFKQMAIYNVPKMDNPAKKPLMLRISFEDSLKDNIQFLYQNFWQNENNGEMPDLKNVKASDMAAYVKEKMGVKGYHVKFMRVNPSAWTYKDIQNTIIEFEAQGYELHVLMIDYLAMIPTTGCEQGTAGADMRDMWRRMRNFCSARNILMISPHQLSTEAKMLIREGRTDFVKAVANKGYYDGTKRLDQEVDGELTMHLERLGLEAYLTFQRGKHRLPTIIPEADKYLVLKFTEKGCILDDLDKVDTSRTKVGGGFKGTVDEFPSHEFIE